MKRNGHIALWIIFLLPMSLTVLAANDMAATWTSFNLKQGFEHGLSLTLRGEFRSRDNITTTDVYFFRLTGAYKPCPYLSLGLAYDFLSSHQNASQRDELLIPTYYKHSHRMLADATFMAKAGQWNFSLRERYVMAYSMPVSLIATNNANNTQEVYLPGGLSHTMRSMPQIKYAIFGTGWAPYVAVELYNSANIGDLFKLQQYHLFAGMSYKVNDMHSFNFFYVLQHKSPTTHPSGKRYHTIGIDYTITLPSISKK